MQLNDKVKVTYIPKPNDACAAHYYSGKIGTICMIDQDDEHPITVRFINQGVPMKEMRFSVTELEPADL